MKVIVDRSSLLDALGDVAGVVPARSPKPILQSVKLSCPAGGPAVLLATDLECGIRAEVPGVRVDEPGAVVLPPTRLGQILRSTRDDAVAIEEVGGPVTIRASRSRFTLPAEVADLFPDPIEGDADAAGWSADGAELRRAIRRTAFATDPASTQYALAGVLLEFGGDGLTLAATDGRRLAVQPVAATAGAGVSAPGRPVVVPARTLRLVERLLDGDGPATVVPVDAGGGSVVIRSGRAVVWSRLTEGRFPPWRKFFEAPVAHRVELGPAGPLLGAVEAAAVTTSKESRGVDWRFAGDTLHQSAKAADVGESSVEHPVGEGADGFGITFDSTYLAEALRTLDPGAPICGEFAGAKAAAVFGTADGFKYVVMPLSRE